MIVADTNLVAYLLVQGEFTREAEQVRQKDRQWAVPSLFRSELLNVLVSHVRFRNMDRDRAIRYYRRGLALVDVNDSASDPVALINLCMSSGCSSYDAEFVHLAMELGVRLVTADAQIINAFPDVAVDIGTFAAGG